MAKSRANPTGQLSLLLFDQEQATPSGVGQSPIPHGLSPATSVALSWRGGTVEGHTSQQDPLQQVQVIQQGQLASGSRMASLVQPPAVIDIYTDHMARECIARDVRIQDDSPVVVNDAFCILAVPKTEEVPEIHQPRNACPDSVIAQTIEPGYATIGRDIEASEGPGAGSERRQTRIFAHNENAPPEVWLKGEGEDIRKDSPKMLPATTATFKRLLKSANTGDLHPLRNASWIMTATGMAPHEIVALGHAWLEAYLGSKPVTRRGELTKNPRLQATRILLCMRRLAEKYPDAGLPEVGDVTKPPKLSVLSLCDEPPAFVEGRRRWVALYKKEMDDDDEPERNETSTPASYVRSHRIYVSVADKLGCISQLSTMQDLYQPKVYNPVIAELELLLTPAAVPTVLSGVLRIVRDLHSSCPRSLEDLTSFSDEVGRRFPDQALSDTRLDEITALLDDPTALVTLLNAPRAIELRAMAAGLKPKDQLGRLSAALAWALKLDRVGLSVDHLAQLDGLYDFRGKAGVMEVRFPDPTKTKKWVWKRIAHEVERLLRVWRNFRLEAQLVPTLLFPGDDGNPRETRCAMKLVSTMK